MNCIRLALVAAFSCSLGSLVIADDEPRAPVGTAFTYQGRLKDSGDLIDGCTDLRFSLWDSELGPTGQIGATLTFAEADSDPNTCTGGVDVIRGLFDVSLDFGVAAFAGEARWLQVELRPPPGGSGNWVALPRQRLNPSPYSIGAVNQSRLSAPDGSPADALVVEPGGSIGIGTSSPTARLDVRGSVAVPDPNTALSFGSSARQMINLWSSTYGIGVQTGTTYFRSDSRFAFFRGGVHSNAVLDPGGGATRMVIEDNGYVGIGTSSPTAALDVRGNVTLETGTHPTLWTGTGTAELNRYLHLANSPGLQTASGLKVGGALVSDNFSYANPGKNDLVVKGTVAIGTTSPQSTLHVRGNGGTLLMEGADSAYMQFYPLGFAAGRGGWLGFNNGSSDFFITNERASGDIVLSPQQGNVGIGTSSPTARLDVRGSVAIPDPNTTLSFGSSTRQMINLFGSTHAIGVQNLTTYFRSPSDFAFFSGGVHSHNQLDPGGGTARMVIGNNGNVGIGTSSPSHRLVVDGSIATRAPNQLLIARSAQDSDVAATSLGFTGAVGGVLTLSNNGNNEIRAGHSSPGGRLRFFVNNTASPTASSDGILAMTLTSNGRVGIGTDNPQARLDLSNADTQYGLWASNFASGGTAIRGDGRDTGTGVYASTTSGDLPAVFADATATTGSADGLFGRTYAPSGAGVLGVATSASGENFGVYGETESPQGWGGYFIGRGFFSGRVGVGTTAPAAKLHVETGANTSFRFGNSSAVCRRFGRERGEGAGGEVGFEGGGDGLDRVVAA